MTSFRRTRSAILQGTKDLISLGGLRNATMIEIADTAQVSRATLYNHFRDKDAVLRALMESEVERLFNNSLPITEIAWEISSHPALATLRRIDPGALTDLLARSQDELWLTVRAGLESVVASPTHVEITLRWLIGQFLAPLSKQEISAHALFLAR